jgi:hypothetical protein
MEEIRLAEVIISLAMATGLGMGQSMDWALRGCLLSVRFAEAIKIEPSTLARCLLSISPPLHWLYNRYSSSSRFFWE